MVPAASERETVVTNGMSEFARNGANANSALVVSVSPEDFGKSPLDGVKFVRSIEKKAYSLALNGGKYFCSGCGCGKLFERRRFPERCVGKSHIFSGSYRVQL